MITDSSVLTRSRRSSARVLITTESNSCLGQTISGELTKGPRMLSNEGRSFRCVLREREETFHMVSAIDHAKKFFFKYGCRIIVATGITFSKFLDFSLIKKNDFRYQMHTKCQIQWRLLASTYSRPFYSFVRTNKFLKQFPSSLRKNTVEITVIPNVSSSLQSQVISQPCF